MELIACLVAAMCVLAEPPERHPQSEINAPPAGITLRWFTLAQEEADPREPHVAEAVEEGSSAAQQGAAAAPAPVDAPDEALPPGPETEEESSDAHRIKARDGDVPFAEGFAELRAAVLAQWPHDRDITQALDDLETYLAAVALDDPDLIFDHRTAWGISINRDIVESMLTPATSRYVAASTGPPPKPEWTPPPPPPTPSPRSIDPTLEPATDRALYERLWRNPPMALGHHLEAVDCANVFVSAEPHLFIEHEVEWPINGVCGGGTAFGSPQTMTIAQRLEWPEDPADSLAIRLYIRTTEDHTGLVRFDYRYDHWLAAWVPLRTSSAVFARDWGMWLRGF